MLLSDNGQITVQQAIIATVRFTLCDFTELQQSHGTARTASSSSNILQRESISSMYNNNKNTLRLHRTINHYTAALWCVYGSVVPLQTLCCKVLQPNPYMTTHLQRE
ncbi:hypothetical protein F2P81_013079 [Scophthalmus maximus]|uniref:Uncharacterized protein n=1 Tax=Scophthalmus maximus TaxID=52904 RepID=A0A6A4SWE4_SCOMX|nr:hypothetical protein F2P81_013079 [Scophthalmus maximus]